MAHEAVERAVAPRQGLLKSSESTTVGWPSQRRQPVHMLYIKHNIHRLECRIAGTSQSTVSSFASSSTPQKFYTGARPARPILLDTNIHTLILVITIRIMERPFYTRANYRRSKNAAHDCLLFCFFSCSDSGAGLTSASLSIGAIPCGARHEDEEVQLHFPLEVPECRGRGQAGAHQPVPRTRGSRRRGCLV
jgi:hypothetical protein